MLWLNVSNRGKVIGSLALLSRKASLDCGIKNSSVMLFEIEMDAIIPLSSRTNMFTHIPEYPMTDYDVSMLFDQTTKWNEIYSAAKVGGASGKNNADDLLQDMSFIDEYRGRQVPDGRKSITFRLRIGSLAKTLTTEEIESCAGSVIKRLSKALGAEIRS